MATNNNSSSNPRVGKIGDVLDALSGGIAKTAANKPKFEPRHLAPEVPAEPTRELLTEKMLADRWESLDQFEIVLAEKVGFEPTVMLPPRLISSQVHSTTLPLLRCSTLRWVTAANSISALRSKIKHAVQSRRPCKAAALQAL